MKFRVIWYSKRGKHGYIVQDKSLFWWSAAIYNLFTESPWVFETPKEARAEINRMYGNQNDTDVEMPSTGCRWNEEKGQWENFSLIDQPSTSLSLS